jgi:cell fate regulator YaaT (PSP1 superfamily)
MGCSSCGTATGGKPSGCKSNGGCSTGGCNRLNVHNWLADLPLYDSAKPYPVIEVSFSKGSRKEFFRNNTHHILEKNDWIAVEGVSGYDVGQVSLTGELVKLQLKKYGVSENSVVKRVLHPATEEEMNARNANKEREAEMLIRSRAIAKTLKLEMKLCEVEIQADGKKGTFFYTADQRVDFRELIKLYANDFKLKVEMKQIGARQESGKVGGIGSCGRELCCSTWLTDFKSVNTTAARYQNLSINQTKLSGQCGRLKCCLNYELDTYMDALSVFPHHAESLETVKGIAHLQKRDIFKNLMWYSFSDNNKQYPLTIERVKEIMRMNKEGQKAEDLQPVELEVKTDKAGLPKADMGFVNDVGHITLKALEKNNKKKKQGNKQGNKPPNANGKPQGQQGGKPQTPNPRPQGEGGKPQGGQQVGKPQGNRPERGPRPQGQEQGNKPQNTNPKPQNQEGGSRPERGPRPPKQQPKPDAEGSAPQGPKPEGERKPQGPRPQQERPKQQKQGPPRQKPPQEPPAPSA